MLTQHYYINIEQMINQIKFKSVSIKKDVQIISIKQVSRLPIVLFSGKVSCGYRKYDSQTHFRLKEVKGRIFAENLNSRVNYWSIGQTILIMVLRRQRCDLWPLLSGSGSGYRRLLLEMCALLLTLSPSVIYNILLIEAFTQYLQVAICTMVRG
jgi:small-conductance mechanosensitive channel